MCVVRTLIRRVPAGNAPACWRHVSRTVKPDTFEDIFALDPALNIASVPMIEHRVHPMWSASLGGSDPDYLPPHSSNRF